ncbi:MAG: aldo/keto reductase [Actinomycetaceae bacterium]|nr:aldo/keto reductase [Actinomycetaceae bacterium]
MNLSDIPIGIGTWYMGENPSLRDDEVAAIRYGLDGGLRVVDTAEMYGNGGAEEVVGEAIAGRRENVYLVSKVLPGNASTSGVRRALEGSLYRLNTDYLDLYLYHWRGGFPLEETIRALEDAKDAGLIGAWGVSNFDVADMEDLADLGVTPVTNQILYNLTRRGPEFDLIGLMRERSIDLMAYSPLEQGRLLSGEAGRQLARIAADLGTSPATLALAWVIRNPGTVAIPKTKSTARMAENIAAIELTLDADVLAELDRIFPAPSGPRPLDIL